MTDLQTQLSPPTANASQHELNALVGLYSQGRLGDARALADELVRAYPRCEITHNIAGALAGAAGCHDEALALYDRAIAIAPDYAEAFTNRGNALKDLGRGDEALASFDAAIALLPEYAEAHLNRGIVLRMAKRFDEALAANAAAIRCNPGLLQAYSNRGNIFQDLNRFAEALADYDRASALDPGFAPAHVNRGNVLRRLRRLPEALASYDRAIALAPDHALAHRNRGSALAELKRLPEALAAYEAACALDPQDATALSEAAFLRAQMCEWSAADPAADLRRRIDAGDCVPPFHLLAVADDPALQLANARAWGARHFPAQPRGAVTARQPGEKIRIGYFSADFHNHATMWLMIRMLELHDKARFEIHAFFDGPAVEDAMRARALAAVDAFHDIRALSDEDAAQRARDCGIDIAVDLKGYTENGRAGIFASRAAPCQVAYLGYPGTTGADYIDGMIADRVVVPEHSRAFYAETIRYLPHSYQVNDSHRAVSAREFTRAELGLPVEGFVFCCLNNTYKISPAEFDIWMRLLSRVEGSVLWLFEDNRWAAANLRREAEARGVDAARLVFAGRIPMEEHLSRQRCADLFLDTFNVNAHTTASDALWVGLPVLTRLGSSFAARVAGSLVHAVGLPELAVESAEAYEALAHALATDPARLAEIKARLAANRTTAPLFDTARATRAIEDLFAEMVAKPSRA